jgi:hypothetical protein
LANASDATTNAESQFALAASGGAGRMPAIAPGAQPSGRFGVRMTRVKRTVCSLLIDEAALNAAPRRRPFQAARS